MRWIKLQNETKKPEIDYSLTTDDTSTKEQWLKEGYNVGILLHNLLVIDIDSYKKGAPKDLKTIVSKIGEPFRIVKTGGGGWHLYYHLPDGMRVDYQEIKKTLRTRKGVDLKNGPRSYVVSPGSTHQNGSKYLLVFENGEGLLPQKFLKPNNDFQTPEIQVSYNSTNSIYSWKNFQMESIKNSGFKRKETRRHRLAWHQACKIADKLLSIYPYSNDLLTFGTEILRTEILNHPYVSTKITQTNDQGLSFCSITMHKALTRKKKRKRTPNYVKGWRRSRSNLLEQGWTPQELAALDTVLDKAEEMGSTKFWLSARQFKEKCPVSDYSLLQQMVKKGVLEIVELGSFWNEKATVYKLSSCPYPPGRKIAFKFSNPIWVEIPWSIAVVGIYHNLGVEKIQQKTGYNSQTIKRSLKWLNRNSFISPSEGLSDDSITMSPLFQAGLNRLALRRSNHQLERETYKDMRRELLSPILTSIYQSIKEIKKRKSVSFNNTWVLTPQNLLKALNQKTIKVLLQTEVLNVTSNNNYSFNTLKLHTLT